MPKNTVNKAAAAKAKKQKLILIVGLVLLLGLGAFQGPKLLKRSGGEAAAPAESSSAAGEPASETTATDATAPNPITPASTPVVVAAGKTVGVVAGVPLTRGASVKPASNQLVSFTLFEVKDPFVPGEEGTPAPTPEQQAASTPESNPGGTPPAGSNGQPPAAQPTGAGTTAPAANPTPPPPLVYATIEFDGKPLQLQLKDQFPADQPLFVLKSLKKKKAKISVAGGSFEDSETFTLKLNKKVTLVNTATGVRYEIKLVYTGAAPEVIEGFTTTTPTGASGAAGTTDTEQTTTTSTNAG